MYQKNPVNSHHWRVNLARPARDIDRHREKEERVETKAEKRVDTKTEERVETKTEPKEEPNPLPMKSEADTSTASEGSVLNTDYSVRRITYQGYIILMRLTFLADQYIRDGIRGGTG